MRLWQSVDLSSFLDCEPSWSVAALQIFESVDRDPGGTSGELKQSTLLLGIPSPNDLPEVLDDLVGFLVATVICMFLPVVDVDICDTTYEEFQFPLVEDVN